MSAPIKDLSGKQFGRLVVEGIAYRKKWKNGYTRYFWKCKCDCGKELISQSSALIIGRTLSCGCYNKELQRKRLSLAKGVSATNMILNIYKQNAKKAKLPFELSRNQFLTITSKNCHYCGSPPMNNCVTFRKNGVQKSNGGFIYSGIDRKDNEIGYILNNCVPCCDICNKAKRAMPYDDFMMWIKRLVKFTLAQGSIP